MTLLAIDRLGARYTIFAPNAVQHHVINHLTGEVMNEQRNMLVEAARIARGRIFPLTDFSADNFDAVIFPGGFGAAKNLCTYAFEGSNHVVREDVADIIKVMHAQKKPIGALCVAPVLLAQVLDNVVVTLGSDPDSIAKVEAMGAKHVNTRPTEVIADKENMVFTTPCYMLPATISTIADSAENLVKAILENLNE